MNQAEREDAANEIRLLASVQVGGDVCSCVLQHEGCTFVGGGGYDLGTILGTILIRSLLVPLQHPNIISYNEAFLDGNRLCIIMELAQDGDLAKVIK